MSIKRFDKDNKNTGPLIEWRYGYWVPHHEYEKLEKQLTDLIIKNMRCIVDKLNNVGVEFILLAPGDMAYINKNSLDNPVIHFSQWSSDQLRAIADHMDEK